MIEDTAETPTTATPWRIELPCARVRLDAPGWPVKAGPRIFRGALIAALMPLLPGGEHSDWTGRLSDDGETLGRPPPIVYRVHQGVPEIFAIGERAHAHGQIVSEVLRSLRLPGGEVIPATVSEVRLSRATVEESLHRWYAYRWRTPYFPCRAAYARRPHVKGLRERAVWPGDTDPLTLSLVGWAGRAVHRSLEQWLTAQGVAPQPHRPLAVQVIDYETRPCLDFSRADRGVRDERHGFSGAWITTWQLPDGLGLGAHASEGYGEVEALGELTGDDIQHRSRNRGPSRARYKERRRAA
jgi:hypothetical protein